MDYFSLGSEISYPDYNAIVYLLRKFKRLTSDLKLGNSVISSDYGVYNVAGGLTSVGGNFILEDDVTISSSDVLLNCFYTFFFTVVDVNLSGTVNRRVVSVTGDTGDDGVLEVVLEPSLLEDDEIILPDFKVDIVFDPHEYYTPVSGLDITLSVDKSYITVGETATVTATVLDGTGSPVEDLGLQFNFNGDVVTDVTDSSGVASAEYTGTGAGWVDVVVSSESIRFYDGCPVATVTGDSITLGKHIYQSWLGSVGDVVIDWGDGSTDTVNNPTTSLTHNYSDGESSHDIAFIGEVTSLGNYCFYQCTGLTSVSIPPSVTSLGISCFRSCTSLTSVTIPSSVTSLRIHCFNGCTSLTSVTIPSSVTSLGNYCFNGCTSLIDYQLYWTGNDIITYDSSKMPNNTNTVFTIPYGQTSNYIAKGYPSSKLVERDAPIHTYSLSIASDKQSILTTESVTLTGTLLMDSSPYTGQSIQLYDGSTLIDTLTTDSNGEYSKTISGLTAGTHTFKAVNTNAESSTITVTVSEPTPVHNYSITITGDSIIQTGDNDNITATLKDNGVVVSGETLNYQIKHGNTVIASGTDTTDNNGEIDITYTGTAIGEVTVEVKYSNLLQETYVIYDSIFADIGVTGKHNTNWWNTQSTGITITTDDSGTTVANTATSEYSRDYSYDGSTLPSSWNEKIALMDSQYHKPFVVEFNLVSLGNSNGMFMGNGSTTITKYFSQIGATSNSHIRIVCDGSTAKFYVDGTLVSTDNYVIGSTSSFALMVSNQSSLKYRDLCIYPLEDVYDITITGNDIIQTGDTDTITAILSNNGIPVTGETLTYEIKHGSTIIDSGTDTTDSNGQITISYTGTGVGDVSVIVSYGSLLQETYELTDYIKYDPTGFTKTTTSSADTTYPSNYDLEIPSINNFQLEFDYNNPQSFRLYLASTKVTEVGTSIQYGIGFTRDNNGRLTFTERTTSTSNTTCQSISSGTNHYKVVFNGNTVSVWVNDVQQVSDKSLSWWDTHFPYYFNWACWAVGSGTVTNIKVKAL